MIMNTQTSEVHINGKYSDAAQIVGDYYIIECVIHNLNLNHDEESILEPCLNVCLKDSCAAGQESPHTALSCSRTTVATTWGEEQHTPDACTSRSSSLNVNASIADKDEDDSVVFADRDSGVVFSSGLIRASGDRVTVQEFCCEARGLAPTLHLVIPSSAAAFTTTKEWQASSSEEEDSAFPSSLPTFALTLPSPITTPRSPIHPPIPHPKPFTRASYYAQVERAPPSSRIPYLPQYCAHTLRPFIPLTNCPLCAIQLLACETWWNSRNPDHYTHPPLPPSSKKYSGLTPTVGGRWSRSIPMLCAPQVLPADCTPTTRSIFYALGLPLGQLDESCVDLDVVDAIMFIPSCLPRRRRRGNKMVAAVRGSSSRIQVLLRRARHFFSAPARHIRLR